MPDPCDLVGLRGLDKESETSGALGGFECRLAQIPHPAKAG